AARVDVDGALSGGRRFADAASPQQDPGVHLVVETVVGVEFDGAAGGFLGLLGALQFEQADGQGGVEAVRIGGGRDGLAQFFSREVVLAPGGQLHGKQETGGGVTHGRSAQFEVV